MIPNRMLAPGERGTPESYEAYCKDNAYWNDLDEASTSNGLADAAVPASQVLPECVRDGTTGDSLLSIPRTLGDNRGYSAGQRQSTRCTCTMATNRQNGRREQSMGYRDTFSGTM